MEGGTLAVWSGTEEVAVGKVHTGTLQIVSQGSTWVWTDLSEPDGPKTFIPTEDKLVPGDIVTYKQDFKISAVGENLQGKIHVDGLSNVKLTGNEITYEVTVDTTDPGIVKDSVTNTLTFAGQETYTLPVTVTIKFDRDALDTMTEEIDLGSLKVSVEQVLS